MKKLFALLLATCMVVALVACGSSNGNSSNSSTPVGSTSSSGDVSTGDTSAPDVATEVEELNIIFNSTYSEVEANGLLLKQFETYLDELSGGKITMTIYWGGTVYDDTTQFQALKDGAVNMISFNQMQDADYVPYLNFGSYGIGSDQNVMDCWNYIMFENETTSALIMEEAAANNMIYLNTLGNGIDCLYASFEFSTLEEFVSKSAAMGTGDAAKFEAMGMTCTFVVPPMVYDSMSRGICDATNCALAAGYSMSWDELCKSIVTDGQWAVGGNYTANLDWWNGLSEAQQAVIKEAASMLSGFSLTMNSEQEATWIAEIEARSGIVVTALSDEDAAEYFKYVFDATAADALNRVAGDDEKVANMTMILEEVATFYGYDWVH